MLVCEKEYVLVCAWMHVLVCERLKTSVVSFLTIHHLLLLTHGLFVGLELSK